MIVNSWLKPRIAIKQGSIFIFDKENLQCRELCNTLDAICNDVKCKESDNHSSLCKVCAGHY